MGYCTISHIQALNPKRTYGASSSPTSTQVEALIERVYSEINTILSGRDIPVPVTSPAEFLDYLVQANAYGVAALAEMGMFPEAGGPGSSPHGEALWSIYKQKLDWLKTGKLPASTAASSSPASYFTQNTTEEPDEDYAWRESRFGMNREY